MEIVDAEEEIGIHLDDEIKIQCNGLQLRKCSFQTQPITHLCKVINVWDSLSLHKYIAKFPQLPSFQSKLRERS